MHRARNLRLEHHPDGHTLAVQDGGREHSLDRVADRVPKVDEVAQASLLLVDRDDVGLDADAPADHIEQERLRRRARGERVPEAGRSRARLVAEHGRADRLGLALELVKVVGIPNRRRLHHLGHAVAELALRQSEEPCGVHKHKLRLVERANEVLAVGMVDRRFAADGRVHHGEQRRRNLHILKAPHELVSASSTYRRRYKAHQVAHHAATAGQHDRVACQAVRQHPVLDACLGLAALALLARWQHVCEYARCVAFWPILLKRFAELVNHAERLEMGVGEQHIRARRQLSVQRLHNVRHQVETQLDPRV